VGRYLEEIVLSAAALVPLHAASHTARSRPVGERSGVPALLAEILVVVTTSTRFSTDG